MNEDELSFIVQTFAHFFMSDEIYYKDDGAKNFDNPKYDFNIYSGNSGINQI